MAKTPVPPPTKTKLTPIEKRQKKIARWHAQIETMRKKMAKSKDDAKNAERAKKIAGLETRVARTQAKVDKKLAKVAKTTVKAERKAVKAEIKDGPVLDIIRTCAYPLCGKEFKPWALTVHHCSSACACLASYKREERAIPQTVVNRIWRKLNDRVRTNLESHGVRPDGQDVDDSSTPTDEEEEG